MRGMNQVGSPFGKNSKCTDGKKIVSPSGKKKRTQTHTDTHYSAGRDNMISEGGSEGVQRPNRPGPLPKQGFENIGC